MPGQALTYKIGEKVMLYLRKTSMMDGISLKDFSSKSDGTRSLSFRYTYETI